MDRRTFIKILLGSTALVLLDRATLSETNNKRYGFTFTRWNDGGFDKGILDRLKRGNIKDVCLHLTFYQDNLESNILSEHKWNYTKEGKSNLYLGNPNKGVILDFIEECKKRNFSIMLKFGVYVLDGGWRSEINPINKKIWFNNYTDLIMKYVELTKDVDSISIGCELNNMQKYNLNWLALIKRLRKESNSRLTYAANWDAFNGCEFFNELDFIGVDAYFPLSGDANNMLSQWKKYSSELIKLKKDFRKEVVFTEVGYNSNQESHYKIFNHVFKNGILPINLAYIWADCDGVSVNGCESRGYGILNKPAEKEILGKF